MYKNFYCWAAAALNNPAAAAAHMIIRYMISFFASSAHACRVAKAQ
jgi:hypothetical protein